MVAKMTPKKALNSAEKLKQISKALRREIQLKNWRKELLDKRQIIDNQLEAQKRDLTAVEEVLATDKELTAVARQMLTEVLHNQNTDDDAVSIYNPKYVTAEDKTKLLAQILIDYKAEHPKQNSVPFTHIKNVLLNRYKIETPSAGLFFRNQLPEYETSGGNKNKAILLKKL